MNSSSSNDSNNAMMVVIESSPKPPLLMLSPTPLVYSPLKVLETTVTEAQLVHPPHSHSAQQAMLSSLLQCSPSTPPPPSTSSIASSSSSSSSPSLAPLNPSSAVEVGRVIAWLVGEAAERNQSTPSDLTRFDSEPGYKPVITLEAYMQRFITYTKSTADQLILSMLNLDRFLRLNPAILLKPGNVHRLFASAFLCTVKFQEDSTYKNAYLALVSGVPVAELNKLECEFLVRLNFRINTPAELFDSVRREVLTLSLFTSCTDHTSAFVLPAHTLC